MSNLTSADICTNGHDRSVVGVYKIREYRACKVCHRASIARSAARSRAKRDHAERLLAPDVARFVKKFEVVESGCWEWRAATQGTGYGVFAIAGTNRLAHRVSLRHYRGDFDDILDVDHLCRNPSCVNPDHLEAVSHVENMARGEWMNAAVLRAGLDAGMYSVPKKAGRKRSISTNVKA